MSLDVRVGLRMVNLLSRSKSAAAIEAGLKYAFPRDVVPMAVRLSPYKRGFNRRSIKYKVRGKTAEIWTESGYGGYLEVGTAGRPAQPYLRPSIERNKEAIARAIAREL